jgi:ribulose-bisphosphate carboxylase large chain
MDRFSVRYRIEAADEAEARARALDMALEQTLEIPRDAVPKGYVEDIMLGRLEHLKPEDSGSATAFIADISYSDDDIGRDFLQLLNIVFGNSSIKPGIKAMSMSLSAGIAAICPGPRFGMEGLRAQACVASGPLMMSAIKPVGLATRELARLAHDFAVGGMHYVKDDHGLVDQASSPFAERLKACVEAVAEANAATGGRCRFVPNVTAAGGRTHENALRAKEAGAGAVMLAPALAGMDIAYQLARDPDFGLPIVTHPAFGGANVVGGHCGFSHALYYGQISRLMGADAVVFPNFGGRFGFTRQECLSIAHAGLEPLGALGRTAPAPGGGMSIEKVDEMKSVYGPDIMYLVGGALLRAPEGVISATRRLVERVRNAP